MEKEWFNRIEKRWQQIPQFSAKDQLAHLAIICDGNRRAAISRGLDPFLGHQAGVYVIKGIIRAFKEWGIPAVTFWTWSTENWQRDQQQVDFVMGLAERYLSEEGLLPELIENQASFTHLGRKDRLPINLADAISLLEGQTNHMQKFKVNLALDYGGVDELGRAFYKAAKDIQLGLLNPEIFQYTPAALLNYLDTAGQPNPDLIIRTGMGKGELPRTSGFMPLQTSYAVWKFLPQLFPDLTPRILFNAIKSYLKYDKRLGK